jgi:fused-like protein
MGPSVPPPVVLALAQIIMTHETPTELLLSQATEILNSIFSVDSAAETALIIAAHLARMSKDFLPSLAECGALNLAERALQSDVPMIRAKALDFVANLCRHAPLPNESLFSVLHSLLSNLIDTDPVCQKLAALSIGNVLFWSPQMSEPIVNNVEFVKQLLQSSDRKTVENAAGLLGNIVAKSGDFVSRLITQGVVDALVNTLATDDNLDGKTIFPLASYCQYDEVRRHLKNISAQKLIAKYTSSPRERVQRYAKDIISVLGCSSKTVSTIYTENSSMNC